MAYLAETDEIFFERGALERQRVERLIEEALGGADDGELFLEYRQSEGLTFDDGHLKAASFDTVQGFGLRAVAGEAAAYAHASELDEPALQRAGETVRAVTAGHAGTLDLAPAGTNRRLYAPENPLDSPAFEDKVALLSEIDAYARSRDERVKQVSCSLAGSWQAVQILRADGERFADIRPLVRLNISVTVEKDGRMEAGSWGGGGRVGFSGLIAPESWRHGVEKALAQALTNLESVPAPAGIVPVVLGSGWPGILLHEAVGHGLEGDFNRKKTSTFSGRIGERVASPGVTVIDDGTIEDRRGSLTVDDEGTPTERTVLIEDGILTGYMQDRQNARLMGMRPTGNGRRQSFAHIPMPRMTNTIMLAGEEEPEDILRSVDKGVYAVSFGGGQVDITSGKFVFSCTEAYEIEDGKIGRPLKGATLIGNGPEVMQRVSRIGNDLALDEGIGTCGKEGQGVPVGVGQPTMLIDGIKVGGTAQV